MFYVAILSSSNPLPACNSSPKIFIFRSLCCLIAVMADSSNVSVIQKGEGEWNWSRKAPAAQGSPAALAAAGMPQVFGPISTPTAAPTAGSTTAAAAVHSNSPSPVSMCANLTHDDRRASNVHNSDSWYDDPANRPMGPMAPVNVGEITNYIRLPACSRKQTMPSRSSMATAKGSE